MSATQSDWEGQPLLPEHRQQEQISDPENASRYTVWKRRTAEALESKRLHQAVILLIVIDAACVLAELTHTFLADNCSPDEESPAWLEILANISLTITTFFLVEIPLTLWSLGPRFYNPFKTPHASLHLFDAFIITGTFVLEFVLKGRERELAGLLIILRLWRLVKLVGGIAVGAGEIDEELAKSLAEARHQLAEQNEALARLAEENRLLRARAEGNGTISDHTSFEE